MHPGNVLWAQVNGREWTQHGEGPGGSAKAGREAAKVKEGTLGSERQN